MYYRIAGKFGRDILYVWQSLTELPNLNPPIFLQWRFGVQPPNLIPTNISGYTVLTEFISKSMCVSNIFNCYCQASQIASQPPN